MQAIPRYIVRIASTALDPAMHETRGEGLADPLGAKLVQPVICVFRTPNDGER